MKSLKNNKALFTIVTPDFTTRGLTSLYFAQKYNKNIDYCILYLDYKAPNYLYKINKLKIFTIKDIYYSYQHFINKYDYTNNHETIKSKTYGDINHVMAWCTKPLMMIHLLNFYKKIIYIDSDILFVNKFEFLFDQIDSILLSPHHREHQDNTLDLVVLQDGYFNAGFVGASRYGLEALRFWANCCYEKCENNKKLGLFYEQKYLDLLFMMNDKFSGVKSINHYGCNAAPWNIGDNKLKVTTKNILRNRVFINQDLLIFIHFSNILLNNFSSINELHNQHIFKYYINKYLKFKEYINKKINEYNNSNSVCKLS